MLQVPNCTINSHSVSDDSRMKTPINVTSVFKYIKLSFPMQGDVHP
jgi:hypothetical protein